MIPALALFALTYVLMLRLPQERPWVALCSAAVFIALGEVGIYDFSLGEALRAVDYNVLLMMAGTMGTVSLFIESKMPAGRCARWRCSRGSSAPLWTMWPRCSWWPRWGLPLPAS